ncbi:MAG: hypothetical protein K2K77_07990 [Duncaniella sp.]|nr:hypothetical protein [Duncaniella sp.]
MASDRHLTLDVAIITCGPEGILRVADMNLPVVDRVKYIVSWQDHRDAPVPASLVRDDIRLYRIDGIGLSLNRNHSLSLCSADIILITDDDITFTGHGLTDVIATFENNPDVDVATFRSEHTGASVYPHESCQLGDPLPKGYSVASFEIALRRSTAGHLRCHPLLGLGSPDMHGGEDEILLLSAIKRGLNCRFFPVTICRHPHASTGYKSSLTDKNLRAMGCVIALYYPYSCALRIPLKAWRVKRARQAGLLKSLLYLTQGALRAHSLLPDKKYLW